MAGAVGMARLLYPNEVHVNLVSDKTKPVTYAQGMRVLPERTWNAFDELPPPGRDIEPRPNDRFVDEQPSLPLRVSAS